MLHRQGDDSFEVNSEFELDEDDEMPYDDLTLLCKMLLKKYDLLKEENKNLKNENDFALKEKFLLKINLKLFQKKMNP